MVCYATRNRGRLHTAISDVTEDTRAEEGDDWCHEFVRVKLLFPLPGE